MIKFNNTDVWGFEHAFRGMRNPMNSWSKSDSKCCCESECSGCALENLSSACYIIGENDMNLAQRLIKGGSEHRKFLRQIFVSVDITAPMYWWKEMDQYRINVTTNSTSTMHKIHAKKFTLDDFSCEHLIESNNIADMVLGTMSAKEILEEITLSLNFYREKYLETKDKKYWWQLIQLLPSSYNQTRTITMTYENLLNMYRQRKNHKLDEWRIGFVEWVESIPYAKELIVYTGEEN